MFLAVGYGSSHSRSTNSSATVSSYQSMDRYAGRSLVWFWFVPGLLWAGTGALHLNSSFLTGISNKRVG